LKTISGTRGFYVSEKSISRPNDIKQKEEKSLKERTNEIPYKRAM
jgi:hypothetical protein